MYMPMDLLMKVNGNKINAMDKANILKQMGRHVKGSGNMIK